MNEQPKLTERQQEWRRGADVAHLQHNDVAAAFFFLLSRPNAEERQEQGDRDRATEIENGS